MWNRARRLAIVKNHTCTRTYILHAALVIAFFVDRLYTHISSVFLSQAVTTCLSHHHRLQEPELKELVEMLLVNVPGIGVAVLWQTEGSPNAASCGQKPEFRELSENYTEPYFSGNFFQQPAGQRFPEQHGMTWSLLVLDGRCPVLCRSV